MVFDGLSLKRVLERQEYINLYELPMMPSKTQGAIIKICNKEYLDEYKCRYNLSPLNSPDLQVQS